MVMMQHKEITQRTKEAISTVALTTFVAEQAFLQISNVRDHIALKQQHKKGCARIIAPRRRTELRQASQSSAKKCPCTMGFFEDNAGAEGQG